MFDLASKAIFRPEVAKLRRKLEQLDEEHEREVQHLKQQIKELKALVQHTSPRLSSEKPAEPASERITKVIYRWMNKAGEGCSPAWSICSYTQQPLPLAIVALEAKAPAAKACEILGKRQPITPPGDRLPLYELTTTQYSPMPRNLKSGQYPILLIRQKKREVARPCFEGHSKERATSVVQRVRFNNFAAGLNIGVAADFCIGRP